MQHSDVWWRYQVRPSLRTAHSVRNKHQPSSRERCLRVSPPPSHNLSILHRLPGKSLPCIGSLDWHRLPGLASCTRLRPPSSRQSSILRRPPYIGSLNWHGRHVRVKGADGQDHRTRVLYERQCGQAWYAKWKRAKPVLPQSLHMICCMRPAYSGGRRSEANKESSI